MSIASPQSSGPGSPRVVFFGRRCLLSVEPLGALLDAGMTVSAVVVPARRIPGRPTPAMREVAPRRSPARLRMAGTSHRPTLDELALAADVPLLELGSKHSPAVAATLAALSADIFAVSCFPWRLPAALVRLPRLTALNVHPSLLPRHRGPDPLFWTYRAFERQAGVTVHLLSEQLDAGAVVAQAELDLPIGAPGDVLEARCAALGGRLLVTSIMAAERSQLPALPQDESRASYEGWPGADDLRLEPDWTAVQIYHFTGGVIPLGYHPTISIEGQDHRVLRVEWQREAPSAMRSENWASVARSDGALRLLLAGAPGYSDPLPLPTRARQ